MLLEFSHTFIREVLENSKSLTTYANRPQKINPSDIQLALQNYNDKYFPKLPNIKELAEVKNKDSIPPPPSSNYRFGYRFT